MKYLRKAQISCAAKVLEHADPAPKDGMTFQDLFDLRRENFHMLIVLTLCVQGY